MTLMLLNEGQKLSLLMLSLDHLREESLVSVASARVSSQAALTDLT